jgi:GNAT superfamily N-acetyltransferase
MRERQVEGRSSLNAGLTMAVQSQLTSQPTSPRVAMAQPIGEGPTFRVVEPGDEPALREMLFLAIYVPPGSEPPNDAVVAQPELARYVSNWGREGDDGIIAFAPNGDAVGAAWLRLWSADDHGYGFIDTRTPEVSVAMRPFLRGRGIGTQLLQWLLRRADESYDSLSLSVSVQNPAIRLYQRLGFTSVTVDAASITMRRSAPRKEQ